MLSRVLVTGAGGFVGSRLVSRLAASGTQVVALTRRGPNGPGGPGEPEGSSSITWIQGDVTEPSTYRAAIDGVEGVAHLAARLAARRVPEYEHANVVGTGRLLATVAETCPDLRRAVVVSTVAAMGPSRDGRLLRESEPCRPVSEYGSSKLAAEHLALTMATQIPITILRPAFVYGPGDSRGAAYLEVWLRAEQDRWRSPIRTLSLVHVDDFARACVCALTADVPSGERLLVAAPAVCDWIDIRSAVAGAFGSLADAGTIDQVLAGWLTERIERLDPNAASGPPPEWWGCDTSQAERMLGFSGRSLTDGALETVRSYVHDGLLAPPNRGVPQAAI